MEESVSEILKVVTSFGVTGIMFLWLLDVRSQIKDEKIAHDRTRQKLEDALKDCSREDDTRRVPRIPESERVAYKKRLQEPP